MKASMFAFTAVIATTTVPTLAHADLQYFAPNALAIVPFESGTTTRVNEVMVESIQGQFSVYSDFGTSFRLKSTMNYTATAPKGMAVVRSPVTGDDFLFETEASGLYYWHSANGGGTWDAQCALDPYISILGPPSAVALGNGGFQVVAERSDHVMVIWHVNTIAGACSDPWISQTVGNILGPPVIASWGAGRTDIFAHLPGGTLEHWYSDDLYATSHHDTQFPIDGVNTVLRVSGAANSLSVAANPSSQIAKTTAYEPSLQLVFRDPEQRLQHLYLYQLIGWSLGPASGAATSFAVNSIPGGYELAYIQATTPSEADAEFESPWNDNAPTASYAAPGHAGSVVGHANQSGIETIFMLDATYHYAWFNR